MNKNEQAYLVQKIRTQYTEKQHTELEELKALDRCVKRPATTAAYLVGTVAALVMGSGMSLVMTDIGSTIGVAQPLPWGIAVGTVGMLAALVNYPIYKRVLNGRRKRYADEIVALSDKLLGE